MSSLKQLSATTWHNMWNKFASSYFLSTIIMAIQQLSQHLAAQLRKHSNNWHVHCEPFFSKWSNHLQVKLQKCFALLTCNCLSGDQMIKWKVIQKKKILNRGPPLNTLNYVIGHMKMGFLKPTTPLTPYRQLTYWYIIMPVRVYEVSSHTELVQVPGTCSNGLNRRERWTQLLNQLDSMDNTSAASKQPNVGWSPPPSLLVNGVQAFEPPRGQVT